MEAACPYTLLVVIVSVPLSDIVYKLYMLLESQNFYGYGMPNEKERTTLKKFGMDLALIRNSKSLTQEQLASKSGLDRMTIALIENGRRWPRLSTLQMLAKALDVDRKSTRLNSSHPRLSRMPSSA